LRATPVDAGDTRARRFRWLLRHHPLVFATAAVGVLGLVCVAAGAAPVADWVIGSYCAAIALFEGAKAVRQLLRRVWGLDVLAVTAIASTLLVGEFWASLVIVLMLTGGAALEDYAVERARGALTALLRQTPRVTHRNSGPVVDDVDVETVVVGDRLQVLPGETVPVDGILTSGTAVLDESALTGESMPVTRQQGQKVLSGAVNGGTVVEIRALAVAADSEFQRIVALVEAASNSKAPFVRLADRFAIPFTLVAYVVAGVAWAVSGDALRFAEVLVVATPCPLLIAAPVAFVAGMDRAAKSGIIVRSGGAFEQLARVRSAAFDKTGTLTYGRPNVDRIEPLSPYSSDELLVFVAAVESKSQHVLAGAVVQAARSARLQFRTAAGVVETPGKGAAAVVGGRRVVVGRIDFVDAGRSEWPGAPLGPGEMAVYASVDGVLAGRVVLRDETRGNSGASVRALRDFGVEQVVMLTGDGVDTAEHVGAEVGVEDIRASLLPAQKVAAMATLSPRPAMMVGDGVNDAPVLAAADVGVAMGARGSTAASETADVVVLVDDLDKVVEVVRIARRTIAVALQSIWVGIGLSLVLMVVAAFGVIPAIVGAGLQELVDVATIANALRAAARGRR
jgi:heavy metal translocating P-type ATPase